MTRAARSVVCCADSRQLRQSGVSRIVLDNTYVSRKSRAAVIQAAARAGLPVRCVWLQTSVEDAQVNAVGRMLSTYGKLLSPEDMRLAVRTDVSAFGPAVQFRYERSLEPPDPAEGFAAIDTVPFERRRDPSARNRALILWCDGVLARSRSGQRAPSSPDDVEVVAGRGEVLRRYAAEGWPLLGLAWRPEIAEEKMSTDAGRCRLRPDDLSARRADRREVLPARWRTARVLVPQTAARPGRRVHPCRTSSIRRNASTSARGTRTPRSHGVLASSIARPTRSSAHNKPQRSQRTQSFSSSKRYSAAFAVSAVYSWRNASIGSVRLARWAGIRPASADTIVNSSTVDVAMSGSRAWMPYSCAATY